MKPAPYALGILTGVMLVLGSVAWLNYNNKESSIRRAEHAVGEYDVKVLSSGNTALTTRANTYSNPSHKTFAMRDATTLASINVPVNSPASKLHDDFLVLSDRIVDLGSHESFGCSNNNDPLNCQWDVFSDGKRVLTRTSAKEFQIVGFPDGKRESIFGIQNESTQVFLSKSGQILQIHAAGNETGTTIEMKDTASNKRIGGVKIPHAILYLEVLSDGKSLCTVRDGGILERWNVKTGLMEKKSSLPSTPVFFQPFSNSQLLITFYLNEKGRQLRVLDADNFNPLLTLDFFDRKEVPWGRHGSVDQFVQSSSDAQWIIIDNKLYKRTNAGFVFVLDYGNAGKATLLEGSERIVLQSHGKVSLGSKTSTQTVREINNRYESVKTCSNKDFVVVERGNAGARFYSLSTSTTPFEMPTDIDPVFMGNNRHVVTTRKKAINVWDTSNWRIVFTLNNKDVVNRVRISPDGRWLEATNKETGVTIWDLKKKAVQYEIPFDTTKTIQWTGSLKNIRVSPDGLYAGVRINYGAEPSWPKTHKTYIYDLGGKKIIDEIAGMPRFYLVGGTNILMLEESGRLVFRDFAIKLDRFVADIPAARFSDTSYPAQEFFSVRVSSRTHLAAALVSKCLFIVDTNTGEKLFDGENKRYESMALSKDERLLVVAEGATVSVFDTTARTWRDFKRTSLVTKIGVSPNNKYLAWIESDRNLVIFDLEKGKAKRKLAHPRKLYGHDFAWDSNSVITTAFDGIRKWDLQTGKVLVQSQ